MSKLITKIKEVSKRNNRRKPLLEDQRVLTIRLPPGIYACTSNAAHDQRTSMNALVTAMIEHCLDELYKESAMKE